MGEGGTCCRRNRIVTWQWDLSGKVIFRMLKLKIKDYTFSVLEMCVQLFTVFVESHVAVETALLRNKISSLRIFVKRMKTRPPP